MAQERTVQRAAIAIVSLAFHAVILTGLALHRGRETLFPVPDTLFAVTVLPRFLTSPEQVRRVPAVIKIRKADHPRVPEDLPPLVLPQAPGLMHQPTQPPLTTITADQLGQALRNGGVGCNPPGLPGLSREARDICEARLAAGARNANYLGNGMARDKQAAFDKAAAPGNAWRSHAVPVGMGNTDVSAEAALKRNQMAPGRPGDTQANWGTVKIPF